MPGLEPALSGSGSARLGGRCAAAVRRHCQWRLGASRSCRAAPPGAGPLLKAGRRQIPLGERGAGPRLSVWSLPPWPLPGWAVGTVREVPAGANNTKAKCRFPKSEIN